MAFLRSIKIDGDLYMGEMPDYMAINYCEAFFGKANYDYAKARKFFQDLTKIAPLAEIRRILFDLETRLNGKIIPFTQRMAIINHINIILNSNNAQTTVPENKLQEIEKNIHQMRVEWSGSLDNIGIPQKFSGDRKFGNVYESLS